MNLDQYFSPLWVIDELLDNCPSIDEGYQIFEPCVGKGSLLTPRLPNVVTNDIDPNMPAKLHMDATKSDVWKLAASDWTITNPPYSSAFAILKHAYTYSQVGVALLMRLSFMEPTIARRQWLHDHPPDVLIVLPRISYAGYGSDTVTSAWMVWYILGSHFIKQKIVISDHNKR